MLAQAMSSTRLTAHISSHRLLRFLGEPIIAEVFHGKRDRIRILATALFLKRLFKHEKFRLSLPEGYAGPQAASDDAEMVGVDTWHQPNRDIELDSTAVFVGSGLHHADDGIRLVVDQDGLSQDVRIRTVTVLPEPVREDDNMVVARAALLRQKVAAEEHRLQHRPAVQTWSDGEPTLHTGRMVGVGEVENQPRLKGKALERVTLRCKLGVLIAVSGSALAFVVIPDHDQLIGVRIGLGGEKRGPYDAEDGHVRSNAECQSKYGDRGEAGTLP